ncbi:hypothetical protein H010_09501 [Hydrogenophaga taeniospiralis CCUG 15921]|uniref:DUF4126 domain-containing protein n=1 Tax=Hydrogenophaga taeniospiralis CCUG 15921 TaxID=1281780 RepID=A0A9X4S9S7_9BURK|nr:DUF4126 domain-containing protein [Hydrogenophaga taeniospiralis]MDG5975484.1 hypothetical protein [Hydrogenophaga taeniospiralis CCUG 15921]
MDALWTTLVNWLHGLGLHAGTGVVHEVGGQVVEGVSAAASQLDMPSLLALAAALGWVSGFRLYAVVFIVGMAGWVGWIPLPEGLQVLQHPAMLAASGALLFVEFFADKIPGLDSLWDMVNSVIRIPAGAALAAGALGADGSTMALVGALLGGTLAASSQAAKTTTRAAINSSPEPFSNIAMSLVEDGLVVGTVWLATQHPLVFGVLLVIAVVLMWIVTWMLFKFLRAVFRRAQSLFSSATA